MTEEEAKELAKRLLSEAKQRGGVFASLEERKAHTFRWVGMPPPQWKRVCEETDENYDDMTEQEKTELNMLREKRQRTDAEDARYRELLSRHLEETLVAFPHEED